MGAVGLGDVDDVGAVQHGHVDRLVAGRRDLSGGPLRLPGQVELLGEGRAELNGRIPRR